MIKQSILVLLLVAVLNFDQSNAKLDHCPLKRRQEADQCAKDVFFLMDPNFKPATAETLPDYCKKMDSQIKCIEKYGKDCLKGFTKQSLTIGTNGFKKLYKQICPKNAPKQAEFIRRTNWIKKDDVDEIYTCAGGAIKNYKYINEKVENDDQIQQGCCNYWAVRDCMDKKMKKLTTSDNQKFFADLTDETLTNLIRFLCAKQDSLATCHNIMPKELGRMEKVIKSIQKGQREGEQSFLIPFLGIVAD